MTHIRKKGMTVAGIAVSLAVISGCTSNQTVVLPTTTATRPTSAAVTRVTGARTADAATSVPATMIPALENDALYTNGVYNATGQYGNLPSSIGVTVTLDDDIITAVEVVPHATNPTSLDLQRRFAAAVPAVVVGRRIDEVRVDRLAGSSGTPKGFNAAIDQIKEQARSR